MATRKKKTNCRYCLNIFLIAVLERRVGEGKRREGEGGRRERGGESE